jgi:hypothetical protein
LSSQQAGNRSLKLVCCVCFLLIAVALLLIDRHSPATGYELSIYEALPAAVWICLVAALGGGTAIVVYQAFAGRKSTYWLLGFLSVILGTSIILLLPHFRGYFFYGVEDTVGHLAWTQGILWENHFWVHLRYPITHILTAQIAQVSGVPPEIVMKCIPAFFTVLFMLSTYLLASSVMPRKGQALLAAAATALFFSYYHVCVYPQSLAMMILPLLFHVYFKGQGEDALPFRVVLVILLLLFPYFHPAPAGVLIACLLAAEAAKVAWRLRVRSPQPVAGALIDRISLEPTLICTVTFLTWISSYVIFDSTIRKIMGWLAGEIRTITHVEAVEQMVRSQGLGIQEQTALGLKMYGDNLIYLSLSAIALLVIAWRFLRREDEVKKLSVLSMPFLVSGPVWVLIFAATTYVTVGRLLGANIMMWATPVFAAFALYELFGGLKRVRIAAVTSVLVYASVVGIFGVYHSPYILQVSWQVTRQDIQGLEWFSTHADLDSPHLFASLGGPAGFGGEGRIQIPDHFGRPRYRTLGSLGLNTHLLVADRFRLATAHPTISQATTAPAGLFRTGFTVADFERLDQDPTVSRTYSNGELDVYRITSEK